MADYENILAQLYEMLKPSVKADQEQEIAESSIPIIEFYSLKVMTLVEEVEDYFDISIPLNILANVRTTKDFATQLQQLTEEG